MPSREGLKVLILGLAFVCSAMLAIVEVAESQPTVRVTLLIVPEREACKPGGYPHYEEDRAATCTPVEAGEVERWKQRWHYIEQDIPPSRVSLGPEFLEILASYLDLKIGKLPPDERRAMVLMFEWRTPQSGVVTLRRPPGSDVPQGTWKKTLQSERRFINHQRADIFSPGYQVEWTLLAGGHTWVFTTGGR